MRKIDSDHIKILKTPEKRTVTEGVSSTLREPVEEGVYSAPLAQQDYRRSGNKIDVILLGASTGGTEAFKIIFKDLTAVTPPLFIVQHIPEAFAANFAASLSKSGPIPVSLATDGTLAEPCHAYLAPGGNHLRLSRQGDRIKMNLSAEKGNELHMPSIDLLFQSALTLGDPVQICAALLTGMGRDGAMGLKALNQAGHYTIAQSEETCVVYGMPMAAVSLGAAREILPLNKIAYHLMTSFADLKDDLKSKILNQIA
jgi:two-component system chemotaxis response regulator CheB